MIWFGSDRARARRGGWLLLLAVALIGYAASAAIRAIAQHPARTVAAPTILAGYEAEDHFPGAALIYARDAPTAAAVRDRNAAPAAGATGTAVLPIAPLPAGFAASPATDGTVRPAPPFSTLAASAVDRGRAIECLTAAIYYEAGSEPATGQRAVAQVVLNRVRHPAFPHTVCGVVYQGSARASGCQFSFACDGAMARVPAPALWRRSAATAALMLGGYVEASVGLATHYHTFAVTPAWNRSLVMTAVIGAHFFHRWQGYWGTPAAFTQRYLGGEPIPGPQTILPPAIARVSPAIAAGAVTPPMPTAASTLGAQAIPQSDTSRTTGDTLPSSPILDRWKDSGKPLR